MVEEDAISDIEITSCQHLIKFMLTFELKLKRQTFQQTDLLPPKNL